MEPLSDGIHVITKLDMKKYADREKDFIDYKEDGENKAVEKIKDDTYSTELAFAINIIIAYTLTAKNSCPDNVRDWARNAVYAAEQTYLNSGVNISLNLVYLYRTDYSDGLNMQDDLDFFISNSDPYMNEIHTFRSQYNAQICVLMVDNKQYNGIASAIYVPDLINAFLIVNYDAASSQWSLAHEIGHLIGVRHQYQTDRATFPKPYGHGFFINGPNDDPNTGWRTVMAIPDGEYSTSKIRIPYYSDPNAFYLGVRRGESLLRDNVRALNELVTAIRKQKPDIHNKIDVTLNFELMQNYPNPFNPCTTISYTLPKDGFVTLKIYDSMGREISSLVSALQTSGNYKVQFDGSNLPSGIYFCRLGTREFSSTKKLVLMK